MAALNVPDATLRPAAVGNRGARALQRLDIDNQRRTRMLDTLQQMGLDKPNSGIRKRNSESDLTPESSRNNSADSVRRSSDPKTTSSNDASGSLTTRKINNGRRRSLMVDSLGSFRNTEASKPKFRQNQTSLIETLGTIPDLSEPIEDDNEESYNRLTLIPGTSLRDIRSGRRNSLLAPGARLPKSPRTSIEGADLFSHRPSVDSLQIPVSRRRSRRGPRTPKLQTEDQDEDGSINVVDAKELRAQKMVKSVGRFRSYVRMLICFMRLCESFFLSAPDDGDRDYFDDEVQLMFDVRFFKAIKQSDISQDCRKILAKPPHQRTEKEKYHALIALRNFPTFAEYPLTMQQEIVSCGWYARYQAKRVILRQGHMPLNFYFILSGSVVVRVVEEGTGVARTVVYLNRGETFGELGIVNRSARQSTIIAREWIELLMINDEDYTRIFMAGGLTKLLDPDHSDFVKNLKFLEGWPLPLLAKSPKKCIFSYFKRKDILVKDSKKSDWIVVVKSGSCAVMKLLYKEIDKEDTTASNEHKALPKFRNATKKKRSIIKPRLSVVGSLENFEQRKKREDFEDFMNELEIQEHRDTIENRLRENTEEKMRGNSLESILEEGNKKASGGKVPNKGKKSNVPQLSRTAYLARKKAHERVFQEVAIIADANPNANPDEDKDAGESEITEEAVTDITTEAPVGKRKTLVDEIMDTDLAAMEIEEGMEPVWVTVQTLTKGSVFGLAEMMFDDQPSFVVVSNGAECILLSKKFYTEHATLAMMSRLRKEEHRFPTEDELKAGLEIKLRWNTYKEAHIKDFIEHRRMIKESKT